MTSMGCHCRQNDTHACGLAAALGALPNSPIILIISTLTNCRNLKTMMLQYDFEESTGAWLTLTTQAYHRAISDELAPHGITYRQSTVLGWLALEGELSQTELAARMMVEPPTLVGILDRMERDGWITRHNCPGDRRKKIIRANPAAEPVWEKIVDCALRVRHRAIEGFSERELTALKTLLRRLQQNLKNRARDGAECENAAESHA
jgi:MarR family transcriptional regulator, transcriptional regulator for hemolysin